MSQVLPIVFAVALFGVIFGINHWLAKKRTAAMEAWASGRGFSFVADATSLMSELGHFKLFGQGRSRRARNCATGRKEGFGVRIADYQYTTGSGKSSTTHVQTICALDADRPTDVHFFCRRQVAFFDAVGKLFGGQDVNFDDDPAFSKAYVLQTNGDVDRLRMFMSPSLRALLTELSSCNLILEVTGTTLLLHTGVRLKPEQIEALIDDAIRIRRAFS
jgi:hypothetical protein